MDRSPIEWALLPFKHPLTFRGRAPRAEYWWFYLATVILGFLLDKLDGAIGAEGAMSALFSLAMLIPWVSVTVRRLHDIDRTGWWLGGVLVPAIALGSVFGMAAVTGSDPDLVSWPFLGGFFALMAIAITLFVFSVLPGTDGSNRYGADPYGPDDLEEVFA